MKFISNNQVTIQENPQYISLEEAGIQADAGHEGIMRLRWESNRLIESLWQQLAGYSLITLPNKKRVLAPNKKLKGLLSTGGASSVILYIKSVVNSVTSLSNLREEEAETLQEYIMENLACKLGEDEDYENLSYIEKETVLELVRPIIWSQFTRGIKGHESEKSITNIQEQRASSNIKESITQNKKDKDTGYYNTNKRLSGGTKPWE